LTVCTACGGERKDFRRVGASDGRQRDSGCCCADTQVTEASTVVLACDACPLVKLDDKHYKLVDKLEALVAAPPSLRSAKSLTVKGPVRFVAGTSIADDCLIVNGAPQRAGGGAGGCAGGPHRAAPCAAPEGRVSERREARALCCACANRAPDSARSAPRSAVRPRLPEPLLGWVDKLQASHCRACQA